MLPAAGGPPSRHICTAFAADALRQSIANAAPAGGYWRVGRRGEAPFRNCRSALPGDASLASDAGRRFWRGVPRPLLGPPAGQPRPGGVGAARGAARSCAYLRKSNGLWPQQRPLSLNAAEQHVWRRAARCPGADRAQDGERVCVSAGYRPGTQLVQDCQRVRIYVSEQRPQQDSNLRTRLRRPLLYPLSYGGLRASPAVAGPQGRCKGYQP